MKIFFALLLLAFLSILFTGCNFLTKEQRWQWAEFFGFHSGRPNPPTESDDISSIIITDDIQKILYNGVYLRSRYHMHGTSYLRFYENGMVIEVNSTGNPEQIKRWFDIDCENISKGNYERTDNSISFSCLIEEYGSVDYTGMIIENGLILNVHSNINGWEGKNLIYEFYSW
ncbi:MAG: hypothetical protein LBV43_10235 [Prevotella sp.]|jgi:hypothetical protein|nr:hypothetical protein [Prevotella sp.]